MAIRTSLDQNFYIWHPRSGIQRGTLYIVAHAERTAIPKRVSLPKNTTMDFLCAAGQNIMAKPIQIAFAQGGAVPYGSARRRFVDNYNLFKSPSNSERPSGAIESYETIASIPDEQMWAINSDILTVRKRASSLTFHSGLPFLHRGSDLESAFAALESIGHRYNHYVAYFCRGDPFREASSMTVQYANEMPERRS